MSSETPGHSPEAWQAYPGLDVLVTGQIETIKEYVRQEIHDTELAKTFRDDTLDQAIVARSTTHIASATTGRAVDAEEQYMAERAFYFAYFVGGKILGRPPAMTAQQFENDHTRMFPRAVDYLATTYYKENSEMARLMLETRGMVDPFVRPKHQPMIDRVAGLTWRFIDIVEQYRDGQNREAVQKELAILDDNGAIESVIKLWAQGGNPGGAG